MIAPTLFMTQPPAAETGVSAPTRRHAAKALLGLAVASMMAGCDSPIGAIGLTPPQVSLGEIELEDVGFTEVKLLVRMKVDNPNTRQIPIGSVVCQVDVLGQRLADGQSLNQVIVPSKGSAEVPLRMTIPTRRMLDIARNAPASDPGQYSYRVSGHAQWGSSSTNIPFERSGNLKGLFDLLPWGTKPAQPQGPKT